MSWEQQSLQRVAVVIHPARPVAEALDALQAWARTKGLDVVQIHAPGFVDPLIASCEAPEPGDLIVALGGDGTVLSALRAALPLGLPVLGTACGSLGVLTAVGADALDSALERVYNGDWTPRRIPALAIRRVEHPDSFALNDFVAVRRRAGQLVANVSVDDELYVRLAGDGLIVATALGSTAYSMAAGGPVLARGTQGFLFTPIAMHGGNAPPLVIPADSTLHVELQPGFAGFDIEIDGHDDAAPELEYTITLVQDKATLVEFGDPSLGLTELRDRQLISDSARVLARDNRLSRARPASAG